MLSTQTTPKQGNSVMKFRYEQVAPDKSTILIAQAVTIFMYDSLSQ